MATWSYRVVRHFVRGVGDEVLDEWYAVHEAYSGSEDEDQPEAITVTPVMISGETPEALRATYAAILKAFEEPILDEDDFTFPPRRNNRPVLVRSGRRS